MNFEKVIFGFFVVFGATLNFGFWTGDIDVARHHVGQSKNIEKRLAQHVSRGKFTAAEAAAAKRLVVKGNKTRREVLEQSWIDMSGGIKHSNSLNKVNPIGKKRSGLMPRNWKPGYNRYV